MAHVERRDGRRAIENALDALNGYTVTINYKDTNRASVSGVLTHDKGGNPLLSVDGGPPRAVDPTEIESVDF